MQSLLAYLVLNPVPHARQHLAFLFWPESTEAQARTNLRRELHHLRRALPEADTFLSAETNEVCWRREAPYTLDAATFEAAIAEGERRDRAGDRPGALAQLTAAARGYGELLPGGYDGWLLAERERLSQRYASTLARLVRYCESAGDWPAAISWAQRQLQHDALREATYRDLIRLYRLNDDRSSALRVYHNCATILQRELGVEPEAATQDLYRQLVTSYPAGQVPEAPVRSAAGRPALIGRQREWANWEAAWQAAAGGRAQVVCLAGEAGIGKTRLAEEMLQAVSRQGMATAWAACYAAESELPFAPVAEWLKRPALRPARAKLPAVWLAELVRLLPELLTEQPELPPPQPLTENWQRLRLFEALARAVLAARQPLLLVIDDVQWCDADTLAWLRYLLRFDVAARLLIMFTLRVEDLPAAVRLQRWLGEVRQAGQLTEVSLGALNAAETEALAAQLVGRRTGADFARWIFRETEGNPLFVVETVRTTTQPPGSPSELANLEVTRSLPGGSEALIPPRVLTVIGTRLAQLSVSARELASLAATIGRDFTFAVLAAASERDAEAVARDLDDLWQRRLVREQGGEDYDFSHDKIREVAAGLVSAGHRRLLHRRIAQALEAVYRDDLESRSHDIAAHYDQGGLAAQAIPYYQRAAAVAQALYANEEAVTLLKKALVALASLPAGPVRDELELALQTGLGVPLLALKGYSAPDVRAVYIRARQLGEALGRPAEPPVLRALALVSIVRSEFGNACQLGEQVRQLAEQRGDTTLFVEAHYVLGVSYFWLGEFEASRRHLEQALESYDPAQRREHVALYAQDPAVVCRVRLAYTLWYLGWPSQAQAMCEAALALGREVGHPFSLAYALNFAAWYANDSRNRPLTRDLVAATQALATEQGFSLWAMMSNLMWSWTLAEDGATETGIEQIRKGMLRFEQQGATLGRTYYLALLARAHALAGQATEGLTALAEALALESGGEEHWYAAELYRLRGELLAQAGGDGPEVEACYQRAIAVAQRQAARPLELRAALSLSRLWQHQGRAAPARQVLQAAYAHFSEGFDTPDLAEARAQLQALD